MSWLVVQYFNINTIWSQVLLKKQETFEYIIEQSNPKQEGHFTCSVCTVGSEMAAMQFGVRGFFFNIPM